MFTNCMQTVDHIPLHVICLHANANCISRPTVVSCEAKEEVPCNGLLTNAREYFTRTNFVKMKNAITDGPNRS